MKFQIIAGVVAEVEAETQMAALKEFLDGLPLSVIEIRIDHSKALGEDEE